MATSEDDEPRIRLLARRPIGDNARFEVFLDDIEDARGVRVRDYLAVEPRVRDADGVTGIAVLPLHEGRVGLMRVARHPLGASGWEIPMGFIDAGETPEAAALREMAEETGLQADPASLVPLGGLSIAPSVVRSRIRLYAADAVRAAGAPVADEAGHGRFAWFGEDEALALAGAGEIVEPCTLVALYRFALRNR